MSTAVRSPESFSELTSQQKKSGLAAWLGWMFDGLDMHLYTLVALPFVASLLAVSVADPAGARLASRYASIIQAGFLLGWALGGAFFGRLGDVLGRSRALSLTILTYASFTGLSYFAHEWWHLLIFRFLAALGIGGEWAVGASLLSETWPKKWRPWIAAVLQTGVNVGVLLACLSGELLKHQPPRMVFLVGIVPALLVLWIRQAVPEPEEWHAARHKSGPMPGIPDLFRGDIARVTWPVLVLCGVSLTAHWTFMFWHQTHLRKLPALAGLTPAALNHEALIALLLVMLGSIAGNFLAGGLARCWGYRRAVTVLLAAYAVMMFITYSRDWDYTLLRVFLVGIGMCQGVFALFTMCLPPLFPTLLRTTGAGFCYNFGRIVAAAGTVFFGLFNQVGDYRQALLYAAFLFIPAALLGLRLPEEVTPVRA
ncbi:MAG: MFS transporter [Pedosphaera sp.]|nr:MFS transporter [Pedosphaera sp.]